MVALALVAFSGLLAGAVHVVTGVDHLAALVPLSVGRGWRAFGTGLRWGLGHSGGVLVVGALALLLRERFDVQLVGVWGERAVGLLLVALGALALRRALRLHAHAHEHGAHQPSAHVHWHAHAHAADGEHAAEARHHGHAAFVAGTFHGIAGSGHLLGVLPALALPGWVGSAIYLLAFGLGTLAAMGGFAAALGAGSARLAGGAPGLTRGLLLGASVSTVAVGLVWFVLALRA
jgi:ABC-type nickel/cobalt efflux system permease component RcnA